MTTRLSGGLGTGAADPLIVGCGLAVLVRHPWLAAGFGVRLAALRHRAYRVRRRERAREKADAMIIGRVVHIGLSGGLPLSSCLELALGEVGTTAAGELHALLRTARWEGMSAAMTGDGGPLLRPLLARIALAQTSGAPMHDAVSAFLAESRAAIRSQALEKVRRLPVTLMIPLGLLILPGFVVLFAGPIVLSSLVDLVGTLP